MFSVNSSGDGHSGVMKLWWETIIFSCLILACCTSS